MSRREGGRGGGRLTGSGEGSRGGSGLGSLSTTEKQFTRMSGGEQQLQQRKTYVRRTNDGFHKQLAQTSGKNKQGS